MILTLVRGLPGSGKSAYAKSLGCLHLDPELFRIVNGVWRFDWTGGTGPELACLLATQSVLISGADAVVSAPFVTRDEIMVYERLADRTDATLRVVKTVGTGIPTYPTPPQVVQIMRDQWDDFEGETIHELQVQNL